MENLPIALNELSPIIIALIEKIQVLDSAIVTKKQKIECIKEIQETVDEFHGFFAKALKSITPGHHTKIFTERIERAFSQFDWDANVGISPYEFQKHSDNAKVLISSILKLIGMKGCGILIIETYLKLCIKIVNEMLSSENSQMTNRAKFKSLLDGIFTTTNILKKYWHIAFSPNHKNSIALCLTQLCKVLPFLLKMIEIGNSDIEKFALSLLQQCLSRILNEIHSSGDLQAKDCGQEFITLMDYCLNKLNDLANGGFDLIENVEQTITVIKPMVDEILCYAMSVSQVTDFENDRTSVLNASLKVIKEFTEMSNLPNDINVYELKLISQSVGESLCSLERQVNITVLRLVLEVFTGIDCPLKNIVNRCRTDLHKDNKASDDLDSLIAHFDKEMDKIMQIGLFTISCTSNSNRILRIQSCLASLESLEVELIPSLTSLYMNCNTRNKSNFQQLIDLWLNEMTELKSLIDSILDPAGFCEIVENQIRNFITDLEDAFYHNPCLTRAKTILFKITRYSRKLIKTLRRSFEDECDVSEETEDHIKNFQNAVHDCEILYKLLDGEQEINNTINRTFKRAEFLLDKLKILSLHLFALVSDEKSDSEVEEKTFETSVGLHTPIPQHNYYKLCYSTQLPVENGSDMEMLTPYINKGILRSKRRSILYRTPTEVEKELKENFDTTLLQARHWSKIQMSKNRSRCCKPLNTNLELGNTIDLEITSILENLTQLNTTFLKSFAQAPEKSDSVEKKKTDKMKDATCGTETPVLPSYKTTGCCAKLNSDAKENSHESEDQKSSDELCVGENLLGSRLRNQFLQSLNDLSHNESLLVSKESENSEFGTLERLNDLKIIEDKINFLKQQVPCILP